MKYQVLSLEVQNNSIHFAIKKDSMLLRISSLLIIEMNESVSR